MVYTSASTMTPGMGPGMTPGMGPGMCPGMTLGAPNVLVTPGMGVTPVAYPNMGVPGGVGGVPGAAPNKSLCASYRRCSSAASMNLSLSRLWVGDAGANRSDEPAPRIYFPISFENG